MAEPGRPRSCTVVSGPGSMTSIIAAEAHEVARPDQRRLGTRRVEEHHIGAPEQPPAAGRVARVHAGVRAGDRDRPARPRSRGFGRRGTTSRSSSPVRYAQPGMKPRNAAVYVAPACNSITSPAVSPVSSADLGEVRPVVDDRDLDVRAGAEASAVRRLRAGRPAQCRRRRAPSRGRAQPPRG